MILYFYIYILYHIYLLCFSLCGSGATLSSVLYLNDKQACISGYFISRTNTGADINQGFIVCMIGINHIRNIPLQDQDEAGTLQVI